MKQKENKPAEAILKKRASVSMHPAVWLAVKQAAKAEGRNVSNYLETLLIKQLKLKI